MADKPVTVAVPEERVPEFYSWFAQFLAAAPGAEPDPAGPSHRDGPWGGPGGPDGPTRGRRSRGGPSAHRGGPGRRVEPESWNEGDAETASWLYRKLAPPARELFDLLLDEPERRWSGNALAGALGLEKGAHGVAGILAWPGRYCRKAGRPLPIATAKRDDGGTDYWVDGVEAELFAAARAA